MGRDWETLSPERLRDSKILGHWEYKKKRQNAEVGKSKTKTKERGLHSGCRRTEECVVVCVCILEGY